MNNNIKETKEEDKNNKFINSMRTNIDQKNNKKDNIPFRKLNLKKYNPNSLIQKYRNSMNRNIFGATRLLINEASKNLLQNKIIKNNSYKKENLLNFDSISNSKIKSLKHSYIKNNYQSRIPNLKKAKTIRQYNNNKLNSNIQPKIKKENNNFFSKYASSSVYIPSHKIKEKEKNTIKNIKEYRLGLLSAGSTSYNNVIIPMISLTRQPSGFFNESENEKSSGKEEAKLRKNYMTYRKKNTVSGNFKQRKERNLSSYSQKARNEEFKDVEKLIPKFHKIKIEKGMMDSKLTKTLRDNFVSSYYKNRKYQINNRLRFLKSFNNKDKIRNIFNEIDL